MPVARVLPPAWLVPARAERVILHWTAGGYRPTAEERRHYHFLLQDDQVVGAGPDVTPVRGLWTPAHNDTILAPHGYAAHTRFLNTRSVGIAACCMAGAVQGRTAGRSPLTRLLWERLCQAAAEICAAYGLAVSERTVLCHSEVYRVYPHAPQRGKWDIDLLPFAPDLAPAEIHDQMRRKVSWYLQQPALKGDTR